MNRLRLAAILLLVVGAGLFAIGTTIEKNRHHDEPAARAETAESHDEGGESSEQHEAEEAEGHTEAGESEEGTILGIDREATGLVVLAVIASLALAALLWQRPTRPVWLTVAGFALVFAVFDIAEVVDQLDESATGLALLAAALAATHLTTAAIASGNLRPATAR